MDWKQVGGKLAQHGLNLLGSAVPGASFVTGLVADVLGCVNSPDAVDAALQNASPDQIVELKKLQLENKAELQKIILGNETERIKAVNKTMQVESKSDKWWQSGWRPFWGFISGCAFFVICCLVCILAYKAVVQQDTQALMAIPALVTSLTGLFAIPGAILGITTYGRNKEKLAKIKGGL